MKKTFLAMLLAGSSVAVFAQTDSLKTDMSNPNTTQSMTTNSSYNAYSTYTATLPTGMQNYVMRDYPAATGIRWQQSGDWWHGYYVNAGMPVHLFYNERGQTFTAALPVHQSYVPDAVSTTSKEPVVRMYTLYVYSKMVSCLRSIWQKMVPR